MVTIPALRWVTLLIGAWLVGAAPALAEEPAVPTRVDRAQTSGPAIAIGTSTQTILVGGQLLYYFQLPSPRWRIAIHLGAGVYPVPEGDLGLPWGVNGGTFAAFGRHHRLVFGIEAGTLGWSTFRLHGTPMALRQHGGAGASVGWEWMSSFGMFTRFSVGPAFVAEYTDTPLQDRAWEPTFVGGWVLGYKPW
ncbi:MAG TPA: hypothetical protein VFZ61_16420 [Polyangiales bacterium]